MKTNDLFNKYIMKNVRINPRITMHGNTYYRIQIKSFLFWKTIYENYDLKTTMNKLEDLKSIINFKFIK